MFACPLLPWSAWSLLFLGVQAREGPLTNGLLTDPDPVVGLRGDLFAPALMDLMLASPPAPGAGTDGLQEESWPKELSPGADRQQSWDRGNLSGSQMEWKKESCAAQECLGHASSQDTYSRCLPLFGSLALAHEAIRAPLKLPGASSLFLK